MLNVYYVPEHLLKCFAVIIHSMPRITLWGGFYHIPDFTNEETIKTTLKGKTALLMSQRQNSEQEGSSGPILLATLLQ